ncbi:MAG TPA: hypothetical protein K8V52_09690 [Enterococcus faecalis]|nr:hypothetical protein [Enterococcus faecalis]
MVVTFSLLFCAAILIFVSAVLIRKMIVKVNNIQANLSTLNGKNTKKEMDNYFKNNYANLSREKIIENLSNTKDQMEKIPSNLKKINQKYQILWILVCIYAIIIIWYLLYFGQDVFFNTLTFLIMLSEILAFIKIIVEEMKQISLLLKFSADIGYATMREIKTIKIVVIAGYLLQIIAMILLNLASYFLPY